MAPVAFALIGGMTGATYAAAPSEVLDWTSADVIELLQPMTTADRAQPSVELQVVEPLQTPAQRQLEDIRRESGLTGEQLAEALGVGRRTLYLWQNGGGISAAHEERLHQLSALIDSIELGVPADVRSELVEDAPGGSLLERLRGGESPLALRAAAPWRAHAHEAVARNVAARDDGIVDEDFVFLLYTDAQRAHEFTERTAALLDNDASRRRDWEALLDAEFAVMDQPAAVAVENEPEAAAEEEEIGLPPLFDPAELGIPLGVGAIAARAAFHGGQ
jgi:transcriptional regulator with XRE-family HTH domain